MQPYLLGIDIGTGSTKGVALGLDGQVLAAVQYHYPTLHPEQGYSEQDPQLIWEAFKNCITHLGATMGNPLLAVSFSSAMHSVLAVNEAGSPLNNLITWADVRSEDIARSIRSSPIGESVYRQTGTPIHPMSPLCKLKWLKDHQPGLFEKTYKFISIKEYIWFRLFRAFEIDYALASATGLFDILKLQWSEDACALCGVSFSQLSHPVNTTYSRRDADVAVTALLGLAPDTLFVIGASDGCCANLGSYVTEPGTAALTIGTSGAVRITGTSPVYNYRAMTFNYLLDERTFVSGGAVNNGGSAVDWLIKNFLDKPVFSEGDYNSFFNAVESVPAGSGGLLFLPYLYGERAPIWDGKSSAAFLNIRPEHNQDHFLRAALEGICYALYDVLKNLEDLSSPITQINVSGGFTASATWMQLLADITGKRLMVIHQEDASAIGAIYFAMRALFPGEQLPQPDYASRQIYPDLVKHAGYVKIFPMFKQLYGALKDSMRQLYDINE